MPSALPRHASPSGDSAPASVSARGVSKIASEAGEAREADVGILGYFEEADRRIARCSRKIGRLVSPHAR